MTETFMTLTECVTGYVHSHVIQERKPGIRYSVCQRCHKTLHFKIDHAEQEVGWMAYAYIIEEWP